MILDQNETVEQPRVSSREARDISAEPLSTSAQRLAPSAFTLTELLVVITIIAVLAGLITNAVTGGLRKAKEAAITLEIQQLSMAVEEYKNRYGSYPPNVYSNEDSSLSDPARLANREKLLRALKGVSTRSAEFNIAQNVNSNQNNITPIADAGLSPAEALVFWLQGFSKDITRPLTGSDLTLTSVDDPTAPANEIITIDSREPLFDFDRGRLRMSVDASGNRRYLEVQRAAGSPTTVQIQLYEYLAPNSEEPYVYFDTSRETPLQVVNNPAYTEFFYTSPRSGGAIYPLKRPRADAPDPLILEYIDYVNEGKFQILHCGIDDLWGDFSNNTGGSQGELTIGDTSSVPQLRFPEGPFLGDIADTLGNFGTGTLEDAQE